MTNKENIGKRVIYKILPQYKGSTGYKEKLNNIEGTIVGIYSEAIYKVDFDVDHGGHTCGGKARSGHGFDVNEVFLTLIEDIKPVKIRWYKKGKLYE